MSNILIVGAGLTGAVIAHELHRAGIPVLVIDRRDHIGGNCHDVIIYGIRVSTYGGHIFHTNSAAIWDYASQFTEWQQYEHRVKVSSGGVIYSFPPNWMTLQQLGLLGLMDRRNKINDVIRERFIRGYSEKQWGKPLEDIPPHVIRRIPIRDSWDDRYFTDIYQGLPAHGYTAMIERMLSGVQVELNTDAAQMDFTKFSKVIYTGRIDELFGHDQGRLEYRSLIFDTESTLISQSQGCATLNFADRTFPFTRRMEWRYFWRTSQMEYTLITTETPAACEEGMEAYYPVEDQVNLDLYTNYTKRLGANIIPAGRLGQFRYINMDQAIAAALSLVKRIIA